MHCVSFEYATTHDCTIKLEIRDVHDLIKYCAEVED